MFKTKKFGVILLLTSTCLVYNLPYLSSTFYTQFLEAFNLSNTQAGMLITFFSLTATPGYLFGGMLADKFNPKKLIILSAMLCPSDAPAVQYAVTVPFLKYAERIS